MKSVIQRLIRKLGLQVSSIPVSPYEYLLTKPRYKATTVKLMGDEFKIADTASFYNSHREIFLSEIYKFKASTSSPVIVDCGANYGTSIIYFKKIYPQAKITAVEADPTIFRILEWNIKRRDYKDVLLLNKAISNDVNPVKFFSEGADAGRLHLLEGAQATFEVDPVKLDNLIKDRVDFLKIDIEGAETEAICSSENLDNVSQLFVEYHSFQDTEQTLSRILEKLSCYGFRYYIHTIFCSPRPLTEDRSDLGMDLQLNIFAKKIA